MICNNVHNINMQKNMIKNFFICGFIGWCFECFWTGLGSIVSHKDRKLICNTSLWMFPIYGMAAIISPISKVLTKRTALTRGGIYTFLIYAAEFITGKALKKFRACPWDYSKSKLNIDGIIRLDYAPLWFALGLFFERVLSKRTS